MKKIKVTRRMLESHVLNLLKEVVISQQTNVQQYFAQYPSARSQASRSVRGFLDANPAAPVYMIPTASEVYSFALQIGGGTPSGDIGEKIIFHGIGNPVGFNTNDLANLMTQGGMPMSAHLEKREARLTSAGVSGNQFPIVFSRFLYPNLAADHAFQRQTVYR